MRQPDRAGDFLGLARTLAQRRVASVAWISDSLIRRTLAPEYVVLAERQASGAWLFLIAVVAVRRGRRDPLPNRLVRGGSLASTIRFSCAWSGRALFLLDDVVVLG